MNIATKIAYEWACRCFGESHVRNRNIRALRLGEEAVELMQACSIPKEKVVELVNIVYSRPAGTPEQELGGVAMTAEIMAAASGISLSTYFEIELLRVLAKSPKEFTKRNEDKIMLGLSV